MSAWSPKSSFQIDGQAETALPQSKDRAIQRSAHAAGDAAGEAEDADGYPDESKANERYCTIAC